MRLSDVMTAGATDTRVCLSIDAEWAAPEVLADVVGLVESGGFRATVFCTHAGISVPGHERGIHPNFRRDGETMRGLRAALGDAAFLALSDDAVREHVVRTTLGFAQESRGVRAHSLHYDSQLLPIYQKVGLAYDSTYQMPLEPGLRPVQKEYGILELPIFYNDFLDLKAGLTKFDLARLPWQTPGLKVFNFHPNTVFTNVATLDEYTATKAHYHDVGWLRSARRGGRGPRTLLLELLEALGRTRTPTATLGEVAAAWRA